MPYKDPQSAAAKASQARRAARRWLKIKADSELLERKRATDRRYAEEHREEAAARFAAWAPNNRDKLRANNERYVERHPQKRRYSARNYHLQKSYGISVEQFEDLLIQQVGRCGLCTAPMLNPCIDHDHSTGAVRGLLCFSCNIALGHLRDDPQLCEQAAYIRNSRGICGA